MDPTTRYTVQERVKIVEAYFATKSAILTRRQFRRDFPRKKPPSKLTIRRLLENSGKQEVLGIKIKDTVVSHDLLGEFLPGMSLLNCSLSEDYRFRCKICLHNLYPLLHSVSSCWIH